MTSFEYAFKDGVNRRVIVARHRDPKKTKAKDNGQMPLIDEAVDERELYTHFACVTQIRNKSDNVLWQSYAGRSNLENAFKESKLGFGLEALPSKKFAANQAYVAFLFLAYNLVKLVQAHGVCTKRCGASPDQMVASLAVVCAGDACARSGSLEGPAS